MPSQKQAGWSNSRHASTWLRSLETYAFPRIGGRLVSEVTSGDVLEVLTPIWHEKAQTARRVRQRVRAVLEWAVAMELRPDNPCDRIGPVLGPQRAPVQHMRALPHRDVPAAVVAVQTSGAAPIVKLAFEFLVWAAEETNHPREVVEVALAHMVQNKVEAAYARSDLFERRRRLMNDWSAYVDGDRRSAVAAEGR